MTTNENKQAEPVACLVGMKGGAFDTPTTKRAYTYAHQPNNGPASRLGDACLKAMKGTAGDSIDRGLLLLKALQDAGFGVFDLGAEYTRPEDHRGLIKRIDAAIDRVTQGRGLMSIPADPRSDVDLVLSECKALLEGKNPPFWATQFHPVQPEKKMLVSCPQCKLVFDGKSNRLNSEAQPVQPAVAVNEQDRLDAARYRWLFDCRTENECNHWNVGNLPLKPQDRVIANVATVFMPKVAVDAEIDAAIAAAEAQIKDQL